MARTKFSQQEVSVEVEVQAPSAEEIQIPQAQQTQPKKAKLTVTCVFGPMYHPFANVHINPIAEFDTLDSWLDSQIKAGKLTLS